MANRALPLLLPIVAVMTACSAASDERSVPPAFDRTAAVSLPIIGTQRSAAAYNEAVEVSVNNAYGDFCSGVLVSPRVVLTAAHCIVFNSATSNPTGNGTWSITVPFASTGSQVIKASAAEPYDPVFTSYSYCCYDSQSAGHEDIGAIYLDTPVTGVVFPRLSSTEYPSSTSRTSVYVSAVGRQYVSASAGLVLSARVKLYRTVASDGYTTDYKTNRLTDGGESGGPLFIDGTHNLVGLETRFDPSSTPQRDFWGRLDGAVNTWITSRIASHGGAGPTH